MSYLTKESVGEKIFRAKAVALLNSLSSELLMERPGAEFKVDVSGYIRMDDSAKYAKLFQIGPERTFYGKRKKTELVSARIADYSEGHKIQVICSDPSLEKRVVSGFENIGKTEHENEVHVWRDYRN